MLRRMNPELALSRREKAQGDTIVTFRTDANSGLIAATAPVIKNASPVAIVFSPAGRSRPDKIQS